MQKGYLLNAFTHHRAVCGVCVRAVCAYIKKNYTVWHAVVYVATGSVLARQHPTLQTLYTYIIFACRRARSSVVVHQTMAMRIKIYVAILL